MGNFSLVNVAVWPFSWKEMFLRSNEHSLCYLSICNSSKFHNFRLGFNVKYLVFIVPVPGH